MFQFKKILLISFILFFIFIPKVSAKYIYLGEVQFKFQLEEENIPNEPDDYFIYNLEDLIEFREKQNTGEIDFENKDVYLMDDIDLASITYWLPIATVERPFKGTFHGNFHTIYNLNIQDISHNLGLFGKNDGTITELTVTGNIQAHINEKIGGIVGENCRNNYLL